MIESIILCVNNTASFCSQLCSNGLTLIDGRCFISWRYHRYTWTLLNKFINFFSNWSATTKRIIFGPFNVPITQSGHKQHAIFYKASIYALNVIKLWNEAIFLQRFHTSWRRSILRLNKGTPTVLEQILFPKLLHNIFKVTTFSGAKLLDLQFSLLIRPKKNCLLLFYLSLTDIHHSNFEILAKLSSNTSRKFALFCATYCTRDYDVIKDKSNRCWHLRSAFGTLPLQINITPLIIP